MAQRSESFSVVPPPATHRSHSAKISADSFDILTGNTGKVCNSYPSVYICMY